MIAILRKRPAHGFASFFLLGVLAATPSQARMEGSAPAILSDLSQRWIKGFRALHPSAMISVPPPYGPPQGALSSKLAAFLQGQLDFAFLTRKLADSDVATFRRSHGYDPLVIPVALGSWKSFGFVDPVVVIVNSRNLVHGLSFAELDAIFSKSRRQGHLPIRTWGDVEEGLKNLPMHVVGGASWTKEDSARGSVFRERVLLGGEWRDDPNVIAGGTEVDVPTRVASDPEAIGFTGLGHLVAGTRAVPIALNESRFYIAPTFAAVASARYPLVRTVDLVVARRPGACLSNEVLRLVRYLIGRKGQQAIRLEGHFLPLTRAQRRASWQRASSCR